MGHMIHAVARMTLRLARPLVAKRAVDKVGRAMRPLTSLADAERALETLAPSGTCLSRALAVSAQWPGSEVVIGVDVSETGAVLAHAWVERDGRAIGIGEASWKELTRLGHRR